jgi:hypothetical protein
LSTKCTKSHTILKKFLGVTSRNPVSWQHSPQTMGRARDKRKGVIYAAPGPALPCFTGLTTKDCYLLVYNKMYIIIITYLSPTGTIFYILQIKQSTFLN